MLSFRRTGILWLILVFCILAGSGIAETEGSLAAFPGAEGLGAVSRGGRGGKVIHVTNLEAKGPGSLQWACDQKGPRIIVFDVSGVIPGSLKMGSGEVTIAGQTAPGAGITLAGSMGCRDVKDVIIRFLRFRPKGGEVGIFGADRIILDHVSVCWGTDETLSPSKCSNITIQWCFIEESQVHWEGCTYFGLLHNYAMLIGYIKKPTTLHHNLFAHHYLRAPLCQKGTDLDYRNNVVYNMVTGGKGWPPRLNAVGNYYKAGPAGPHFRTGQLANKYSKPSLRAALPRFGFSRSKAYYDGNYFDYLGGYVELKSNAAEPWPAPNVTTHTAEEAYELVLAHGGCLPRDAVGRRTAREVRTGTGSWGKLFPEGGLIEGLTPGTAPKDTDKDGMTDTWEKEHKLDPGNPADSSKTVPAGVSPGDRHKGYTWIEYYINECADNLISAAIEQAEKNKASGEAYKPQPTPDVSKLIISRGSTSKTKGDVPALVKQLQGSLQKKKMGKKGYYACRELGALGPEAVEAVPAMLGVIEDLTEKRKALGLGMNLTNTRHIVTALVHIGEPALSELHKALKHEIPWLRACAAQAISLIAPKDDSISETLLKLTEDKDQNVRADVYCALNKMGCSKEKYIKAFIRGIQDPYSRARRMAAEGLGRAGPAAAEAVPALIQGLKDEEEPNTRLASAWALGRIGSLAKQAAPALVKALGDSDSLYRVQWNAVRALEVLGSDAVDALITGMVDADPHVRYWCTEVAARLGKKAEKTLDQLVKLTGDTDAHVRLGTARALAKVGKGSQEAHRALVTLLKDTAWQVRWAAAQSLGELGMFDSATKGTLEKAKSDARREVADAAVRALSNQ